MLTARARRGVTLPELTVALVVGGVVLAMLSGIGVRQQRLYANVGRRITGQEQLRHAGAILPIDLRGVSAIDGDIAVGEARDTSLEIRAGIGSSIVCDTEGTAISLVSPAADSELASFTDLPREEDTLWILDETAVDERWLPFSVVHASTSSRPCASGRANAAADVGAGSPTPVVVDVAPLGGGTIAIGMPVRITRRVRYDVYRAGDGRWYLGYRDWNGALGRFNVVQPVSGPFLSPAEGVGFRYFDGRGAVVPPGDTGTGRITRVEVVLRSTGSPTLGAAPTPNRTDSSVIAVALRNRW